MKQKNSPDDWRVFLHSFDAEWSAVRVFAVCAAPVVPLSSGCTGCDVDELMSWWVRWTQNVMDGKRSCVEVKEEMK